MHIAPSSIEISEPQRARAATAPRRARASPGQPRSRLPLCGARRLPHVPLGESETTHRRLLEPILHAPEVDHQPDGHQDSEHLGPQNLRSLSAIYSDATPPSAGADPGC